MVSSVQNSLVPLSRVMTFCVISIAFTLPCTSSAAARPVHSNTPSAKVPATIVSLIAILRVRA
jgi:hypothetical protein